jgi:hypothetical protein
MVEEEIAVGLKERDEMTRVVGWQVQHPRRMTGFLRGLETKIKVDMAGDGTTHLLHGWTLARRLGLAVLPTLNFLLGAQPPFNLLHLIPQHRPKHLVPRATRVMPQKKMIPAR